MLRTFLFLGLALIVGSILIGLVLGIVGMLLGFLIKVVLLGALVYLAIRIISPRTAHRLRERFEQRSLPKL